MCGRGNIRTGNVFSPSYTHTHTPITFSAIDRKSFEAEMGKLGKCFRLQFQRMNTKDQTPFNRPCFHCICLLVS